VSTDHVENEKAIEALPVPSHEIVIGEVKGYGFIKTAHFFERVDSHAHTAVEKAPVPGRYPARPDISQGQIDIEPVPARREYLAVAIEYRGEQGAVSMGLDGFDVAGYRVSREFGILIEQKDVLLFETFRESSPRIISLADSGVGCVGDILHGCGVGVELRGIVHGNRTVIINEKEYIFCPRQRSEEREECF
jgi:hypothetical protein